MISSIVALIILLTYQYNLLYLWWHPLCIYRITIER